VNLGTVGCIKKSRVLHPAGFSLDLAVSKSSIKRDVGPMEIIDALSSTPLRFSTMSWRDNHAHARSMKRCFLPLTKCASM
jgi:hypothetical protein